MYYGAVQTLAQRVMRYIRRHKLLNPGDRVGVAVSGGADSVALLRLLLEQRDELGVVLSVVHFNHKLRGKASDRDEFFVSKLGEKFGLTVHVGRGDVARKAAQEKANLEDAARRARYEFFKKLTEGGLVDCVATAHTADDQAETVLAHILRGTGLAGLGGIHPTTKDGIVRPLLGTRRGDLRKYLHAKRQPWREDATNRDTAKQRARMRKKLLPLLEKEFNPKSVQHLAELANAAREDEALIEAFCETFDATTLKTENGLIRISTHDVEWAFPLPVGDVSNHALGKRLVRRAFAKLSSKSGQLTLHHVEQVLELAKNGENGKVLQLPGGVDVRRDDDVLVFLPGDKKSTGKNSSKKFLHKVAFSGIATGNAVKGKGRAIRLRS